MVSFYLNTNNYSSTFFCLLIFNNWGQTIRKVKAGVGGRGNQKKKLMQCKTQRKKIHVPEIKILAQVIDWEKYSCKLNFPHSHHFSNGLSLRFSTTLLF